MGRDPIQVQGIRDLYRHEIFLRFLRLEFYCYSNLVVDEF
jgi:hypothetical protein